jgi:predicted phosphodiesterase
MKLMIVGDVHAQYKHMEHVISLALEQLGPVDRIVQVGDFGFYPSYVRRRWRDFGVPMHFIRGNHEEHDRLPIDQVATGPMATPCGPWEFIGDGYVDEHEVLHIGGAWSIDRQYRQLIAVQKPDFIDVWRPTEQMSEATIERLWGELKGQSFRAVITHEAPEFLFPQLVTTRVEEPNRTAAFLERLARSITTPTWCFGHHHKGLHVHHDGTSFHCIDMLGGTSSPVHLLEI